MENNLDRLIYFDHARRTAEATYTENPLDPENLTLWGSALLELSFFKSSDQDKEIMIKYAIAKLDEALNIDRRPDTLWWLGNAKTCYAFLIPDKDEVESYLISAIDLYKEAHFLCPDKMHYLGSMLEANEYLIMLHQQAMGPEAGGGPSTSSSVKRPKYDMLWWAVLLAVVAATIDKLRRSKI